MSLAPLEGVDGFSYAHSYGSPSYVSPSGLWLQRLVRRGHMNSWVSRYQSGARMAHLAHRVHGYYSGTPRWTPARGLAVLLGSVNDQVSGGTDPLALAGYRNPLMSAVGMLTAAADHRANEAAWSYPWGTWTPGTNACRVSTSPNAVADVQFTGTACTVHLIGWPSGVAAGRALLRIDGQQVGEVSTGDAAPAGVPLGYTYVAVRFDGLAPGSHVLRVSNSGPAGSYLGVQNLTTHDEHPPTVLVGVEPPLHPDPAAWPLYGPAVRDTYMQVTADACAGVPGVTVVDLADGWQAGMHHPDGVHPNDAGHARIADTLGAVIAAQGFREGLNRMSTS